MARPDDDDDRTAAASTARLDPMVELDELFDDLDALLKSGEAVTVLTTRGVNASLAMLAAQGLRHYLRGEKELAIDDLSAAAEEIRARLTAPLPGDNGRG